MPDDYALFVRLRKDGVELEIAGLGSGRVVERPEKLLPGFDLVFAKARTALEAMAVGCSVVLADVAGSGPLVTTRHFDRMRSVSACIDAQQAAARHLCSVALRFKRADGLECAVQSLSNELAAARGWNEHLANEREVLRESLAQAGEALRLARDVERSQSGEVARTRHALAEQEQLLATFRALTSLRLRDALIRVPILGVMARRAARWLARSSFLQARR